jgi:quercetin dioxygenase-like cupin family protein
MSGPSGEVVRNADESATQVVGAGKNTVTQVLLGPDDGAPNFAMRRFRMEDSGGMPLHTNTVEHEQYVLSGRADIRIGEKTYSVEAGNVLFIPGGVPHSYSVTEAPFEFLCLVPNGEDQIKLLE